MVIAVNPQALTLDVSPVFHHQEIRPPVSIEIVTDHRPGIILESDPKQESYIEKSRARLIQVEHVVLKAIPGKLPTKLQPQFLCKQIIQERVWLRVPSIDIVTPEAGAVILGRTSGQMPIRINLVSVRY